MGRPRGTLDATCRRGGLGRFSTARASGRPLMLPAGGAVGQRKKAPDAGASVSGPRRPFRPLQAPRGPGGPALLFGRTGPDELPPPRWGRVGLRQPERI